MEQGGRIKTVDQAAWKSDLCQAFKHVKLQYSCLRGGLTQPRIERTVEESSGPWSWRTRAPKWVLKVYKCSTTWGIELGTEGARRRAGFQVKSPSTACAMFPRGQSSVYDDDTGKPRVKIFWSTVLDLAKVWAADRSWNHPAVLHSDRNICWMMPIYIYIFWCMHPTRTYALSIVFHCFKCVSCDDDSACVKHVKILNNVNWFLTTPYTVSVTFVLCS